jgi:hypothetical protein
VLITRPAAIVRLNVWLSVKPLLSLTWTVKVKVPLETGVPVIRLLTELRLKPFGSAPAVMVNVYAGVPPVAIRG